MSNRSFIVMTWESGSWRGLARGFPVEIAQWSWGTETTGHGQSLEYGLLLWEMRLEEKAGDWSGDLLWHAKKLFVLRQIRIPLGCCSSFPVLRPYSLPGLFHSGYITTSCSWSGCFFRGYYFVCFRQVLLAHNVTISHTGRCSCVKPRP